MLLEGLREFLDEFFAVGRASVAEQYRFPNDTNGIFRPSDLPIRRLGLALEPWEGLGQWAIDWELDSLFLHRPWKLQPDKLPPHIGVISYHLVFDERLTLGFNLRLAEVLGLSNLEVLGYKEGRAIGMIGNIRSQSFESCCDRVRDIFGGLDAARSLQPELLEAETLRVAIVGAMNDSLVREAAARGAQVYITGQLRLPAELAVAETGMGTIAVGHRRAELWGLRALAGVLRERWADLEVILSEAVH